MSFVELKKINSDNKKSLDVLIKEQFENNFGSSGDVSYIKNTQLGTNLNNLLNGSNSNIDFNNKPLVDKINYILMKNSDFSYIPNGSNTQKLISSGSISSSTVQKIADVNRLIGEFIPLNDGIIKVEATTYFEYNINANSLLSSDKLGIFTRINGTINQIIFAPWYNYNSYIPNTANISVKKGQKIEFLLGFITGSSDGKSIKCSKLDLKYGYAWSL